MFVFKYKEPVIKPNNLGKFFLITDDVAEGNRSAQNKQGNSKC